jgi:acid stress chaperone HdeB
MTDEIQTEDRLVTASLKLVLTALTIPRSGAILRRLGNAACNEFRASWKGGQVMRVLLVTLASTFAILAAPNAQAQISVDLAKVTCKQYLFDSLISANAPKVAVWLSGYFNGKRNNTVIDISAFKKNKDVVEDYCRMNQDVTLIDAATKALGLDK